MSTDKCARKFVHEWETIDETNTHLLKGCWRCKGKRWVAKKDDDNAPRNVRTKFVPVTIEGLDD